MPAASSIGSSPATPQPSSPVASSTTPWCDAEGRVIDDGTIMRLDDGSWRWTAAEGQLRWLRLNARGLDVEIEDQTDALAALALQGPLSREVLEAAAQTSLGDCATSAAAS